MTQATPAPTHENDKPAGTTRVKMSSRRRTGLAAWSLLRLVIVLPVWLMGLALLLAGVALSPWGTGFLLDQGAQRGIFQLSGHEGDLFGHFVLEDFQLEAGPAQIDVSHLELEWADDCLLSRRLCLENLVVDGANIRLVQGEPGEAPEQAPADGQSASLPLPFPVELRNVELNDVSLDLGNGTRIEWEAFSGGAIAEDGTVTLQPTHLASPRIYLPPSPGEQLTIDTPSALTAVAIDSANELVAHESIANETTPDDGADSATFIETLQERERLQLPDITLPVDIRVPDLTVEDLVLDGAFDYHVDRLQLDASFVDQRLEVRQFELASADANVSLHGEALLRDDYPLDMTLESELFLPERYPELAGQKIRLELSGSLADLQVGLALAGPIQADLEGRVDALAPTLPFQASLSSERLQWPLEGDANEAEATPYIAESLQADIEGSLADYQVDLSSRVEGPQIPPTMVELEGEGDLQHFNWSSLSLRLEEGGLVSEGSIDWSDGLQVRAGIDLDQFDPSLFVEDLEGRLDGNAEFTFLQQEDAWALQVPSLSVEGRLQEYPLSLETSFDLDSDLRLQLERLDFHQGNNQVQASGIVSESNMQLDAEIALRQLDSLHPDLAGTLTGTVIGRGDLQQPAIDLDIEGSALRFGENRVDSLSLVGTTRGRDDPRVDLQLNAASVAAGGQRLDDIALSLDGRLSQHRLTIQADSGEGSPVSGARLSLQGDFDQAAGRYQGELSQLEVDSDFGDIRLDQPTRFSANLDDTSGRLEPFCLRREQGGLVCLEETLQASADQGRARLSLREVPMETLEAAFPDDWQLTGDTTAGLQVDWRQAGAAWQAELGVVSDLAITAVNDFGQPVRLPRTRLDASINADQARADSTITLTLADAGELRLELGIADPLGEGRLDGRLTADDIELSPYRSLIAGLDVLEGRVGGEILIGGTTTSPGLEGGIRVTGIRARGPDIPVHIEDGELAINFDGDQGDINGYLAAEQGRLNISGDAVWPSSDDWRIGVDLNAVESPLLVILPQFGRLEAAPDIRVRVTPERLQVRGEVNIPWARIEVGELPPSAISPSPDEVIITRSDQRERDREAERAREAREQGEQGPSAADELMQTGMVMDILIRVSLGEDVQISAYGLEAGLDGTLEVRQDHGALQLYGDINLEDGRFQAFGQDLLIRRGELLFSGPPDLPVLDFEAVRNPSVTEDDVIAGVRVTGTAEEPNVAIFSEPAMNEARALSYLLRGHAPDGGGSAEDALTSALIGMSLGRTGGAVGSLGEAFGIDDLTLDTAGAGDDSQIALTGQLSEDLRISYGVGIFSPIAELTLRYTLLRNLYVQVVTGTSQAVDLIYEFTLSGDPEIFEPR
ncbi:translocation/assembly module TamB domain-containing protein [Halomonas sp. Bachu 37]